MVVAVDAAGSSRSELRRRFAAEGTEAGYTACAKLLALAPEQDDTSLLVGGIRRSAVRPHVGITAGATGRSAESTARRTRRQSGRHRTRAAARQSGRDAHRTTENQRQQHSRKRAGRPDQVDRRSACGRRRRHVAGAHPATPARFDPDRSTLGAWVLRRPGDRAARCERLPVAEGRLTGPGHRTARQPRSVVAGAHRRCGSQDNRSQGGLDHPRPADARPRRRFAGD